MLLLHDVFDGYSISHHDMKDPFAQYGKEINGNNDLKKEVTEMIRRISLLLRHMKMWLL